MKSGTRILLLTMALGAGLFVLVSNQAVAATCTGSHNAADPTRILYDANTDICTISDAGNIPGIDNVFALIVNPTVSPDRFNASKYETGLGYQPVESLIVGGITGTISATSSGVFNDFSGAFIATILANLNGGLYGMVVNLRAVDGNIFVDAARVSAVPLPAALPLFAATLGGFGLIGWRRKRRPAAGAA